MLRKQLDRDPQFQVALELVQDKGMYNRIITPADAKVLGTLRSLAAMTMHALWNVNGGSFVRDSCLFSSSGNDACEIRTGLFLSTLTNQSDTFLSTVFLFCKGTHKSSSQCMLVNHVLRRHLLSATRLELQVMSVLIRTLIFF